VIGMYIAFPLGNIVFNLMTFAIKSSFGLSLLTVVATFIGSLLPCLLVQESPVFLIRKHKLAKLRVTLKKIAKFNSLETNKEIDKFIEDVAEIQVQMISNDNLAGNEQLKQDKKDASINPVVVLFTTPQYLYQVIALSFIGGYVYLVYYGIYMNLQVLGTSSIQVSGMAFAGISFFCSICILPFVSGMRRKRWCVSMQLIMILGSLSMVPLSYLDTYDLDIVRYATVFISIFVVGGVMYAMFTPYYYYVSELFPVDLRGTANSAINLLFSLLAMATPFFCTLATDRGYHFLVGCSLMGLVSLPMTLFLRETHNVEK
jgi:Major Facilitator Superfamily